MRTVNMPGVHGASDGSLFLKCVRLLVRVNEADEEIAQHGLLMRDPRTNRAMLQPFTRLSRDLWKQLGIARRGSCNTLGGRVIVAGNATLLLGMTSTEIGQEEQRYRTQYEVAPRDEPSRTRGSIGTLRRVSQRPYHMLRVVTNRTQQRLGGASRFTPALFPVAKRADFHA